MLYISFGVCQSNSPSSSVIMKLDKAKFAILALKVKEKGFSIDDESLMYIASSIQKNIQGAYLQSQ